MPRITRGIPSDEHFAAFTPYLNGDFSVSRPRCSSTTSRIKSTDGVWIDSIPYHTMIGECMYQMGDLAGALEQYSAALQVFLRYPDWLLLLEYPERRSRLPRSVVRNPPTWGVPTRTIRVAMVPDRLGSPRRATPTTTNLRALQQGGVISMQQTVLVNAKEIVRCTVLALRRRAEILGPAGEHDALSNQLVTVLSRRPAPPNHWTQAWISLQLGLAIRGQGESHGSGERIEAVLGDGRDGPHSDVDGAAGVGQAGVSRRRFSSGGHVLPGGDLFGGRYSRTRTTRSTRSWRSLFAGP